MNDSRTIFLSNNRVLFASIFSFSFTVRKFFLLPSHGIFLSLNTFLCFSRPDVFLPLSLSRVSPPLRAPFLSFSQVKFFLTPSLNSPDRFVSLAHVSSPSLYSQLVLSSSFHRICLTFIYSFPLAHVVFRAYSLAPFLLTLLSSFFPFLFLSRSHTHICAHTCIHSDAYVPTSPWLNEIRTRVSTGDARDASSVCVTYIYTRVQRLVTVAFIRA